MNAQEWVLSNGVYNCNVEVDGMHWRINATLGITKPTPQELTLYPDLTSTAPDWLVTRIKEVKDNENQRN